MNEERMLQILQAPQMTEKAVRLSGERQYVFKVLVDATKPEVIIQALLVEVALDNGADDVITDDDGAIEVLTPPSAFEQVKNALSAAGLNAEVAEVTFRPENTIEIEGDDAVKMQKILDVLEDLDDVQEVYHNAAL